MMRASKILVVAVMLSACSSAVESVQVDEVTGPFTWGSASNVTHVRNLWFSEQPDAAGFEAAIGEGIGVVINLREPHEHDWDEKGTVENLGMKYYSVSVPEKGPFSADAFNRIDALVNEYRDQQILIHCSSANRSAGWFATHLVKEHGMNLEDALAVGRAVGITQDEIAQRVASYVGASIAGSDAPPDSPSVDPLLEQARNLFGILPEEASQNTNPITEAKVDLGRILYYDERLSRNHDVSCNTCHLLAEFGVDHKPTSSGHRGARGARNSPTVYNAAFHVAQFWDGRAADVEEQARGPIQNPVEMAMQGEDAAIRVLSSVPGYAPLFREAFPDDEKPITFDNAVRAIGAFERRLVTPSRFDDFLEGDKTALSPGELEGLSVFIKAGCPTCHSGALLGGHMYQKIGLIHPYETKDLGRYLITKSESDRYVFKVPSLRNIVETGPYFHDGSVTELSEAVRLMAWHQLGREFSASDSQLLITFLGSLTGRIDEDYITRPALPESGPDTPAPDTSDPFERPSQSSSAPPRPADSGPVPEPDSAALIDQTSFPRPPVASVRTPAPQAPTDHLARKNPLEPTVEHLGAAMLLEWNRYHRAVPRGWAGGSARDH